MLYINTCVLAALDHNGVYRLHNITDVTYNMISLMMLLPFLISMGCAGENPPSNTPDEFARERRQMVKRQIEARGVRDPRVLDAMHTVPRHLFVPSGSRHMAYYDRPLPIGNGQTISQPYIVAYMTEALELGPDDKVLEIGTGSGYQAAILAEIAGDVYTVELIPELGNRASKLLDELGYDNIHVRVGDGYKGWPEEAPFDAVIVTAAPERIPEALVRQLREGGRMLIPVGMAGGVQRLLKGEKKGNELVTTKELDVRFVPMVEGRN